MSIRAAVLLLFTLCSTLPLAAQTPLPAGPYGPPAGAASQSPASQSPAPTAQTPTPLPPSAAPYAAPRPAPTAPHGPPQSPLPQQPQGPPPAGAAPATPRAAATPRATAPAPRPAQLTPREEAELNQVLEIWERESGNIKTFKCPFERLEYDAVFGPGGNIPKSKSEGHLRYAKPDKGMFRIDEIRYYDAESQEWKPRDNDPGEHWVCDGTSVYEYNGAKKELIVRELPPDQRGTAIADGPLPFLFGAKREKLRQRYFMRITQVTDSQIWLVAYPRSARDAASYRYVELILDREKFLPAALQVYLPGGKSRTVYVFGDARINDPLSMFGGVFLKPRTPLGWKKVFEKIPTGPTHQASRPGGAAAAPR